MANLVKIADITANSLKSAEEIKKSLESYGLLVACDETSPAYLTVVKDIEKH